MSVLPFSLLVKPTQVYTWSSYSITTTLSNNQTAILPNYPTPVHSNNPVHVSQSQKWLAQLLCCVLNAPKSLVNNPSFFQLFAYASQFSITYVTETCLCDQILDHEILPLHNVFYIVLTGPHVGVVDKSIPVLSFSTPPVLKLSQVFIFLSPH